MQDYIKRLEAEFSLIEKGFKEEEKGLKRIMPVRIGTISSN